MLKIPYNMYCTDFVNPYRPKPNIVYRIGGVRKVAGSTWFVNIDI